MQLFGDWSMDWGGSGGRVTLILSSLLVLEEERQLRGEGDLTGIVSGKSV